jgi:hypothetical protein
MIDLHEQMRDGFTSLSRQISASSSPRIQSTLRQSIEDDRHKDDDIDEDIEEITPLDEEQYYDDEALEQEREAAQKRYEKDHRKQIKVRLF